MEEAVDQHLLEDQHRDPLGEGGGVDSFVSHGLHVGHRMPRDELHGEHPDLAEIWEETRNLEAGIALKLTGESDGVLGLVGEVEFAGERGSKLADRRHRIEGCQRGNAGLRKARKIHQDDQILLDHGANVRPLDLDGHGLSLPCHGPVHLGDGSPRDRMDVELREGLFRRDADLLEEDPLC